MKLSELKVCVGYGIQGQIKCSKKNLKYCAKLVNEAHTGIDELIGDLGDMDVGTLIMGGANVPFLTHDCANQAVAEFNRNYPQDGDKITAIYAIPRRHNESYLDKLIREDEARQV